MEIISLEYNFNYNLVEKETLLTREQKICQLEADLKIEREWRQRLQTTSEADKEALYQQKVEMTHLQTIGKVM